MTFRRGFKTEAERISSEVRSELHLSLTDPLDVFVLAQHLEIPVVSMSKLRVAGRSCGFIAFFSHVDQESFSALTLFRGSARLIVHNDSHHPHRQASNIAHEVSHCLLEHPPAPLTDSLGCRHWNGQLEDEANWLGAALLVPRDGALGLLRRRKTIVEVAVHYGVSESLCRWRVNHTGLYQQVERGARYRR